MSPAGTGFPLADALGVAAGLGFLAQTLRICVPYALAAMGGAFSERGGVINIAIEGIFLIVGAGLHAGAPSTPGTPGWACWRPSPPGPPSPRCTRWSPSRFRADQITSGLGINLLAVGLTRFVLKAVFHSSSNSARVEGLADWRVPGLAEMPGLGAVLGDAARARHAGAGGGRLVDDVPHALRAAPARGGRAPGGGRHARPVAWRGCATPGVLLCGALAGLAGAWLASDQHSFTDQMSGGRGYIALAAMIVGKWTPLGAALACLLFGAAEALQIRLQGSAVPERVPPDAALRGHDAGAGRCGRARAPAGCRRRPLRPGEPLDARHPRPRTRDADAGDPRGEIELVRAGHAAAHLPDAVAAIRAQHRARAARRDHPRLGAGRWPRR